MSRWNLITWSNFFRKNSFSSFIAVVVFRLFYILRYMLFKITFFVGNLFNTDKHYVYIYWKPVPITALDNLLNLRRTMQLHIIYSVQSLGFNCVSSLLTEGVPGGDSVPKEHQDFLDVHSRLLGIINYHLNEISISGKVFEYYYEIIIEEN